MSLNPALGILLAVDRLDLRRETHSVIRSTRWADGKAVNAARAFKNLGGRATAVLIRGGERGAWVTQSLRRESIRVESVAVRGECRQVYLLLSGGRGGPLATRFIEAAPALNRAALSRIIRKVVTVARLTRRCVIAGSLPPGVDAGLYADLTREIKATSRAVVMIDAHGQVLRMAVTARPDIVKINDEEFAAWAGLTSRRSEREIMEAIVRLSCSQHIDKIVVTRGPERVLAYSQSEGMITALPPRVNVRSPVGAGDSFAAGYMLHLRLGFESALRMAVAAGTANVMGVVPGQIARATVTELSRRVRVSWVKTFPPVKRSG